VFRALNIDTTEEGAAKILAAPSLICFCKSST